MGQHWCGQNEQLSRFPALGWVLSSRHAVYMALEGGALINCQKLNSDAEQRRIEHTPRSQRPQAELIR